MPVERFVVPALFVWEWRKPSARLILSIRAAPGDHLEADG